MIDLLCDDVLLMICEYLKPSQLLWLMLTCKRLKEVIFTIVKRRLDALMLIVGTDMGQIDMLPLFWCDLKGKKLYYVDNRSPSDLEFVQQLNHIIPLVYVGSCYSAKSPHEFEKIVKISRDKQLVVILYRPKEDVKEIATLYDIDYLCYGYSMLDQCTSPLDTETKNVMRNLNEKFYQNYRDAKRLVYDMKRKRFCYLDFSSE